jgi:hypothetical protein
MYPFEFGDNGPIVHVYIVIEDVGYESEPEIHGLFSTVNKAVEARNSLHHKSDITIVGYPIDYFTESGDANKHTIRLIADQFDIHALETKIGERLPFYEKGSIVAKMTREEFVLSIANMAGNVLNNNPEYLHAEKQFLNKMTHYYARARHWHLATKEELEAEFAANRLSMDIARKHCTEKDTKRLSTIMGGEKQE